jgi:TM2 domain-containing membrane protein YozV
MEVTKTNEDWNNSNPQPTQENKKVLAGVMGILFGTFGVHKFILGYTQEGIIQLVLGIVSCSLFGLVGFIEGIIYLTKSDEEFYNTYQANKKGWF